MENEIEVMRVVRVPPLGRLVVQVGEERYQKLAEVPSLATQQRLMAAIGELVSFAEGYPALVRAGLAPALPAATAGSATGTTSGDSGPLTAEQQAFLHSLGEDPAGRKATAQTIVAENAPKAAPKLSQRTVAAQVNEILDRHLAGNPRWAGRRVQLHATAAGSLRIEVDGQFYDNPGQIEEKEVRLLIKMALREWDRG